ncbi:12175_t:CDS:2 [Racocetra fulgida]|uniref:12175_t:CDS:1 n=1 Tax=Racocetra fulgida TaxID=60492 RepID=A0A9N9C0P0_9GLOM|nr:12175_t:CDS:2 [Racocetra fulgida]
MEFQTRIRVCNRVCNNRVCNRVCHRIRNRVCNRIRFYIKEYHCKNYNVSDEKDYRDPKNASIHANNKNTRVNEKAINPNLANITTNSNSVISTSVNSNLMDMNMMDVSSDVPPDDYDSNTGSKKRSSRKVHETRSQKPPSANLRSKTLTSFADINKSTLQSDLSIARRRSSKQSLQSPKPARTTRSSTKEKEVDSSYRIKYSSPRAYARKQNKSIPESILNLTDFTSFPEADEPKKPTTAFGIYCLELSTVHLFGKKMSNQDFVAFAADCWLKLTDDCKEVSYS